MHRSGRGWCEGHQVVTTLLTQDMLSRTIMPWSSDDCAYHHSTIQDGVLLYARGAGLLNAAYVLRNQAWVCLPSTVKDILGILTVACFRS
jgi:hypothetical protein